MTHLTCEHCESEIDVARDPRCIQQGGLEVICEACRELVYDRWRLNGEWSPSLSTRLPEACRVKRGWRA